MLTALRSWVGRKLAGAVAPHIRASAVYEAGSQTRRARGWNAPTIGANTAIVGNLRTLRDRSRAGMRNDGYAESSIASIVSNLVGTGILPQCKAPDADFRKQVHALWREFVKTADADGLCDYYGLQALAVRGWLEGGEMFARLRPRLPSDGLVVPLQVQLIEPELVPHEYTLLSGPQYVRAGIEFNGIGQRVGYWCYEQRPEQLDPFQEGGAMVRVPADSMIHLFRPLRAGQIRGVPQLTRALVKLVDLSKYDDATLLRQQLANLFVGFITENGLEEASTVNPITGETIKKEDDAAIAELQPGLFQRLGIGEDVTWSDPPEATGYSDFMSAQLRAACVAAGVPYEVVTGDLSAVNDRTVRIVLQEFRRRVEQEQYQIAFVLNQPVWIAFLTRAILSGALDAPAGYWDDPRPWQRVEWIPPAWPYLHPVQDVQHDVQMLAANMTSLTQVAKERGWDLEELFEEIAAERVLAAKYGLTLNYNVGPSSAAASPPVAVKGAPSDGTEAE
jgi:lambda family phage portal protein